MSEQFPIMHGVWIPGIGWLRGEENRALMFTEKTVAVQTAKRIKQKAKVYFIDQSLVDIEQKLLAAEESDFFIPWFLFDLRWLARVLKGK